MSSPLRSIAAALAAAFMLVAPARADDAAERFVAEHAQFALSVLGDESLTVEEKAARFRAFVDQIADVDRVTRFVLGRYAQSIDEPEYRSFSEAFREYAIDVYESRLTVYGGETLQVIGSTDRRGPADVIVHTRITGGNRERPLEVNWRVLGGPDAHRVVDVEIFGVWLAVNQREEIVSIIGANGGQVSAATAALRRRGNES